MLGLNEFRNQESQINQKKNSEAEIGSALDIVQNRSGVGENWILHEHEQRSKNEAGENHKAN